jgi:CheY-like chemotaxis protein
VAVPNRQSAAEAGGPVTRPDGQLLLILAGRDLQSAAQLAASGGLGRAEAALRLRRLMEQGFIVVADPAADVAVYHLRPRSEQPDELDPSRRILLVESDLVLGELLTTVLEDEGYAIIAADAPVDAAALLSEVSFDLVITDGFSKTPGAVLLNLADLRSAAEQTPVVLFTAHRLELDAVRAAGFRDLIEKPFELEAFESTIRALLPPGSSRA